MKYLLILLILFSCQASKIDYRNKTFRTSKIKAVKTKEPKLKKSKLAKQYRFNELSKRGKRLKSNSKIQRCNNIPGAFIQVKRSNAKKIMKGF